MDKNKIFIFLKYFIIFYILFFLIINWNDISWIFNYRTVYNLMFDDPVENKELIVKNDQEDLEDDYIYSDISNTLEIPRINISVPIIISENKDTDYLTKKLDDGAVLFPDSVFPGEAGQTIILGHSAPSSWPKVKYDWIFGELNLLEEGNEIFVFFNNKKYDYKVIDKIFIEKGEEIPTNLTNSKNILILISCWPPGKDVQRIAVLAQLT